MEFISALISPTLLLYLALGAFAGVMAGLLGVGGGPVSYTHLDVYKRQSLTLRGGAVVQATSSSNTPPDQPLSLIHI